MPSTIYGTIDTATYYPGANLFLTNPAGVVFGATATLNVGGSVKVSTADYLRLTDEVRFEAIPGAQDALLSSAPVVAFGFLGPAVGPITFEGTNFSMPAGQSLTAVGGTITVNADPISGTPALLTAPSGQVRLVSVASPGDLLESNLQSVQNINGDSFISIGTLALDEGMIRVEGGQLVMDTTLMLASTFPGAAEAAEIEIGGNAIQFENGAGLLSTTFDDPGPNITLTGDQVSFISGSGILSDTSGAGTGGSITISASNSFSVTGSSLITTGGSGSGNSGGVTVTAGSTTLSDLGFIGTGHAGTGVAGDITFQGGNLNIMTGGSIQAGGGAASSGTVRINNANVVSVSGIDPATPSRIENIGSGGPTGDILITARQVLLQGEAQITTEAPTQQGGNISIAATDTMSVASGARISLGIQNAAGGTVSISAPSVIFNGGILATPTGGTGTAGSVLINAGTLTMSNVGQILSDTLQGLADGGAITAVASGAISLSGGSVIRSNSVQGGGNAGTVNLTAGGNISLSGAGTGLFSETQGAGAGGAIAVQGNQVQLSNGATISANSTGTGDAGNISITANQLNLFDSSITTQASAVNGGNITIMAGELVRLNNSQINASVDGGPGTTGGNILIDPPFVVLQNNSQVLTQAVAGTGGNITIVASGLLGNWIQVTPSTIVFQNNIISSASQLGISGSINVQSPVFFLSGTLVPLPKNPVQAAALLQARCAARMQGGQASNFVQRGRDGLPPEPGGWLSSPMLAAASPSDLKFGQDEPLLGREAMLVQADVESSPMSGATSSTAPLTKLASASEFSGCGLELVLAQ